jgi:hypothetical protein
MIDWLRKYKHILSIRAIEQELGMKDTLQKAVSGSQKLPPKWEPALKAYLKPFCKNGISAMEEKKNDTTGADLKKV